MNKIPSNRDNGSYDPQHSRNEMDSKFMPLPKYENSSNTLVCDENAVTAITLWENQQHGSRLICGDAGGNLHWYQIGSNERGIMRQVHDKSVSALCPLVNGYLATGSADKHINLISAKKMKIKATLAGHNFRVNALAPGYDAAHLISGGRDGTVRVWDTNMCNQMHSTWRDGNVVTNICSIKAHASHNSAKVFYQTSEQPIVRLWSYANGQLDDVVKFGTGGEIVTTADTTPDGKVFAAGFKSRGKNTCGVLIYDIRKATSNVNNAYNINEDCPAIIQKFTSITEGESIQAIRFVTWSSILAVTSDGAMVRANINTGLTTRLANCSDDPDFPLRVLSQEEVPHWSAIPRDQNSPAIEIAYPPTEQQIARHAKEEESFESLSDEDDDDEEGLVKGPSGISAAYILPRLRYRKFSSYVAPWSKNTSQSQSDINTAFVVTANPLTARDGDRETVRTIGGVPSKFDAKYLLAVKPGSSAGSGSPRGGFGSANSSQSFPPQNSISNNLSGFGRHLSSDNISTDGAAMLGNGGIEAQKSATSLQLSAIPSMAAGGAHGRQSGEYSPRGSLIAPQTPMRTAGLGVILNPAVVASNNVAGDTGSLLNHQQNGSLFGSHNGSLQTSSGQLGGVLGARITSGFNSANGGFLDDSGIIGWMRGSAVRMWEAQEKKVYAMRPAEQVVAFLEQQGGVPPVPVLDEVEGTNVHEAPSWTPMHHGEGSLAGSPVRQPPGSAY
eukprot:GDKJ01022958.1.p1 GENE.GDKJ01022958.1~~GDKJ01022958.1.p1  ORF type:complete len:764 (+),score=155.38 GDKJ01022958.1:114-2294(+)